MSLLRLSAIFAGGNLLASILRMLGGLLVARVIKPEILGLFNAIALVLGYLPFVQLGVLNGLSRELPYYIGAGDEVRAHRLAAAAQAWALAMSALTGAGMLAIAAWYLANGKWTLAAGWATNAAIAVFFFYGQTYLSVTYRTQGDFSRLAAINAVCGVITLLFVAAVWKFGFYGLCLRSAATAGVAALALWRWRPIRVGPCWDRASLGHLLKIGAPIFAVGQLWSWWTVMDSTLVFAYSGSRGLGLYALPLMVTSSLAMLPLAVGQIVYPRMSEAYGRSESLTEVLDIASRPTLILSVLIIPICAICWLLLPPAAVLILPRYAEAVPAAQWALIATAVLSACIPLNAFNVIKRQDLYVIAILLGMLSYWLALTWLWKSGRNLMAFPQAMALGNGVYMVVGYVFLGFLRNRMRTVQPSHPIQ